MTKKSRRVAKARRLLLTLSLVLVVAFAAVGGTIAWLTDNTETITNTFTTSGINIDLVETLRPDGEPLTENETWEAQMIPGMTYHKDPKVIVYRDDRDENDTVVKGTDVDIYLFVKFDNQAPAALTFDSNLTGNGWTAGNGEGTATEAGNGVPVGVYYRKVLKDEHDAGDETKKTFELISGNIVSIDDEVTKSQTNVGGTMTYTAYAIQASGPNGDEFTPADAWANVPKD